MEHAKSNRAIESLKADLTSHGLLLCDVRLVSSLPDSVWLEPSLKSGSLLLVGHAGKKFWKSFSDSQFCSEPLKPDPVDHYSAEITRQALDKHLPHISKHELFPAADCPINLMALGRAFDWHAPSPLGMGIHEDYGLWSAYRAVWWLDAELDDSDKGAEVSEVIAVSQAADICSQCLTQDCVSACPGDAISYDKNPDLGRCADYRLEDDSQCASTCLSRIACPHAAEHRYTEQQMSYHYDLARSAIARYRSDINKNASKES